MFTVEEFKKSFVDRKAVLAALGRGQLSLLSKVGAWVRTRDKSSLRYRSRTSTPGEAPSVHRNAKFTRARKSRKTGSTSRQNASPLRELTFFGIDPATKSVVIGPAHFKGSRVGGGKVPRVVEEGGVSAFYDRGKRKSGSYKPRPHTGPAFRSVLPLVPQWAKNLIK